MLINHADLPIETHERKGVLKKDFFFVKARLEFTIGNNDVVLIGSSYGNHRTNCLTRAKNEIIERFYSHKFVLSNTSFNSRCFVLTQPKQYKIFKKEQVAIGYVADATGLAFNIKEEAETHAICEIIERHWLTKVWYDNEPLNLIEFQEFQDHNLMVLSLANYDVPLIIAIIIDKDRNLLLCGSGVKKNFETSKIHSLNEVYMLYEGYLEITENNCFPITKSHSRILSLSSDIFRLQENHLHSLIISKHSILSANKNYALLEIISKSKLTASDFFIIDFYKFENKSVVRAINTNTLSLKATREGRKNFFGDPFY